jgi:CRP/FNR family transcriptional regulator, cyclic AMP receptor protein
MPLRLPRPARTKSPFDVDDYLMSAGNDRHVVEYDRGATVFLQGDHEDVVMYLRLGTLKLAVTSKIGREALVATLGPGTFFGEEGLVGQPLRSATATAVTACTVLAIDKRSVTRLLQTQPSFSERFIHHILSQNVHIQSKLVDQLFNSSEKRLARTLLRLAGYGTSGRPRHTLPMLSLDALATQIGATRSRVSFFMNRFRKSGFIEFNGRLTINGSLLAVLLAD